MLLFLWSYYRDMLPHSHQYLILDINASCEWLVVHQWGAVKLIDNSMVNVCVSLKAVRQIGLCASSENRQFKSKLIHLI